MKHFPLHSARHQNTKMQKQQQQHKHHNSLPPTQHPHAVGGGSGDSNRKSPASVVPPNSLPLKSNATADAAAAAVIVAGEDPGGCPESRYECAICLDWLNEPVLTSCGHRFCKSCMNEWLRKNNQCCPVDNKKLSAEQDIFPDNYTRREIEQIKFKCPNSPLGCAVVASPIEVDRHLPTCPFRRQPQQADVEEKCPFACVKCDFVGRPETNALEEHIKYDTPLHMQLMLAAFQQMALSTWNPQKQTNGHHGGGGGGGALPPPPPQYANVEIDVIQAMNNRIVQLEQRAHEQDARVENLTRQLAASRQQVDARHSQGTIVWEIRQFQALVAQLRSNPDNPVYSQECYTAPYGYKFCARLSVQTPQTPKQQKDQLYRLSLHVHLMQCENDAHLEWPFKGRIKLCMVHPRHANMSQHDTIMTKPELLAFHKPRERISARGFGFTEYANITDIVNNGFCEGDRLVIKIQMNIV